MQKIKTDLNKTENQAINLIVAAFKKGAVVVYPTDTLYGIGCLATNKQAISRVFKIKKIKPPKPLIVLIKNYRMLHDLCYVSKVQEKYIRNVWSPKKKTRPTTFILRSRGNLPKEILGEGSSLAVRLPKSDFLTTILMKLNQPIISTSLNVTGQEPLSNIKAIGKHFKSWRPDLLIDAGEADKRKPSQIINIRNIKPDLSGINIIR
jgi:L-threonylcarbamoyladenylate synthase